ncbi:MAG: hypothetical protein ACPGGK_08715 [Pikeienuella sp.]
MNASLLQDQTDNVLGVIYEQSTTDAGAVCKFIGLVKRINGRPRSVFENGPPFGKETVIVMFDEDADRRDNAA